MEAAAATDFFGFGVSLVFHDCASRSDRPATRIRYVHRVDPSRKRTRVRCARVRMTTGREMGQPDHR
eukprot:2667274-Prymnesium_polylepis.1